MTTTTDEFIEGIKARITMPASQSLLDNPAILAMADKVITGHIAPILVSLRQDYFVTDSEVATVASQASYDIPYRALGRGLRDLKIIDSNGTTRDVALVTIEDAHRYSATTTVHSFYFKGDKIVLISTPTDALASIQFWFENPPQKMVETSAALEVSAIDTATGIVTFSSAVPSAMVIGTLVDFVKGKQGNSTMGMDVAITAVATPTLTFATTDLPDDLAVGDWVTLAQTSPVVQLPADCVPLLESRTGQRILRALGDYEAANAMNDEIKDEEKNLKMTLEPRIQGEPKVILNRDGLLRGRKAFSRRFY